MLTSMFFFYFFFNISTSLLHVNRPLILTLNCSSKQFIIDNNCTMSINKRAINGNCLFSFSISLRSAYTCVGLVCLYIFILFYFLFFIFLCVDSDSLSFSLYFSFVTLATVATAI